MVEKQQSGAFLSFSNLSSVFDTSAVLPANLLATVIVAHKPSIVDALYTAIVVDLYIMTFNANPKPSLLVVVS